MASTPFITAMKLTMYLTTEWENTLKAKSARLLPAFAASSRSRKSEETPEIPRTPDFLFMISITCSRERFSLWAMNSIQVGSISPERVPITRPSNGVRPIEVSTHFPPSTAEMEEPLPMWHTTIFKSSGFLPRISAALKETYLWDVPWKP